MYKGQALVGGPVASYCDYVHAVNSWHLTFEDGNDDRIQTEVLLAFLIR